jgi:hypothetical protein
LLGLLRFDGDTGGIAPDYDRSPPEVYLKTSCDYIKATSSLLPLLFAGLKNRYPELPSWTIDWTIFEQDDGEQYDVWNAILPLFHLSDNLPMTHIRVEEKALIARGAEADTITTIGMTMDQTSYTAFKASMDNWRDLVLSEHDPNNPYPSGATWNDAWLRTLCADCCWGANSARRANSHDIAFFSRNQSFEHQDLLLIDNPKHHSEPTGEFFRLENGDEVFSKDHWSDIWDMVQSVIQGRKLFLTRRGYLGLGNDQISSGDSIFILPGAPTPLVLRKQRVVDTLSSQKSPRYRLISGCYIHGVMDGLCNETAWNKDKRWELVTIL